MKKIFTLILLPFLSFGQGTPTVQVKTISDLVALPVPIQPSYLSAILCGYGNPTNGTGYLYIYTPESLATNANYSIVASSSTGRWVRLTGLNIWSGISTNFSIQDYAYPGSEARNTFVGNTAGNFTMGDGTATAGTSNSGFGDHALAALTLGYSNTGIGAYALTSVTTGIKNTAIGDSAGGGGTGNENCAFGHATLASNTSGTGNTAVGKASMYLHTSGDYNTALGQESMFTNTVGTLNTAIGFGSLFWNQTGSRNVALGKRAGYWETGSDHLWIDDRERADLTTARTTALIYGTFDDSALNQNVTINGSANISSGLAISSSGNDALSVFTVSNTGAAAPYLEFNTGNGASDYQATSISSHSAYLLALGTRKATNSIVTAGGAAFAVITGTVGIGLTNASHTFQLANDDAAKSTTTTWTTTSDVRTKDHIQDYTKGLDALMQLHPVEFDYNGEGGTPKGQHAINLIAQEVAQVLPGTVKSFPGEINGAPADVKTFNPHEVLFVLINSIKEQQREIDKLRSQINKLEATQ